jgi:hypothetical protein
MERRTMADETRVIGTSLTSFADAARSAFATVRGDQHEGMKAAEVSRAWMTGGGFVGVPQYHVELHVLAPRTESIEAQAAWTCETWHAYHDFMPGSAPTLHVSATCTAPTNGYLFALGRAEPQGINPKDLLLRLTALESGFANEVVTTYAIEYREDTEFRYETVSIVPDGPSGIDVQIVQ